MVHAAHVVLIASLVAAGCMLVARASSVPPEPAILSIVDADALEESATPHEDGSAAPLEEGTDGSSEANGGTSSGLFGNNKIHIQDSRIVLTARDRMQLIRSIAQALVADQKKAAAMPSPNDTSLASTLAPLVSLSRDAFLYLKQPSVSAAATADAADVVLPPVRLGWRYPLAVWSTYKAFITTEGCDVQRVIGDYFYC